MGVKKTRKAGIIIPGMAVEINNSGAERIVVINGIGLGVGDILKAEEAANKYGLKGGDVSNLLGGKKTESGIGLDEVGLSMEQVAWLNAWNWLQTAAVIAALGKNEKKDELIAELQLVSKEV